MFVIRERLYAHPVHCNHLRCAVARTSWIIPHTNKVKRFCNCDRGQNISLVDRLHYKTL